MSLYSIGYASIGEDFAVTKYRSLADEIAKTASVPFGVIAFRKNDANPDIFHFPSAEGANDKYDALANAPGEYAYVYLYRDNKPIDEGYFTATSEKEVRFETKTETRKERVGLGWILGGVALGMLGLSIGFKKGK